MTVRIRFVSIEKCSFGRLCTLRNGKIASKLKCFFFISGFQSFDIQTAQDHRYEFFWFSMNFHLWVLTTIDWWNWKKILFQNALPGLDPARPLIEKHASHGYRLTRDDAHVVQILHTNAGTLGQESLTGSLDLCINGGSLQPFCKRGLRLSM